MSGFSITVSSRTFEKAARLLEGEPVEIVLNLKAAADNPELRGKNVEIVGYEGDYDRPMLRVWVLDEDDMPSYRALIDTRDIATIILREGS